MPRTETSLPDVTSGFHIFRDGNAWCAVGPHFRDIMQSECGFGATPEEAHADFEKACAGSTWWRPSGFPPLSRFTIHCSGEAVS